MIGSFVDLHGFTGFNFTEGLSKIGLAPMTLFVLPAGGFFVFGVLMAVVNKIAEGKGLKKANRTGCEGCPHAAACGKRKEEEACAQ